MTPDIVKDLTAKKGLAVFKLLTEFNRNAAWAGYFYTGADAETLAQTGKYEKTPRHGLHITSWHVNHGTLNPSDFLHLVMEQGAFDAQVLAYADNEKNQAIAVTRPPVYMTPATPHITISWINTGNPAASGYMPFNNPIPVSVPTVMHGGNMKVIMRNNREMDLGIFRAAVKSLEQERMSEIANKLDPQIREIIDQNYDKMTWDELCSQFPSQVECNENLAKLYTQYRIDVTVDDIPSLDELTDEALHNEVEFANP